MRRCTVSIGISIWRSEFRQSGHVPAACAHAPHASWLWTAPSGGHVCTCPRDRLSISTGALTVSRLTRARGAAARMCAERVQVRRPAGPSARSLCGSAAPNPSCHMSFARARLTARAEPIAGSFTLGGAHVRRPRGHRRAASRRIPSCRWPPMVAEVEEWGWWWVRF